MVPPIIDIDGDTIPDFLDLDTDNDTYPDVIEGHDIDGDGLSEVVPLGNDSDNDGLFDVYDTMNLLIVCPQPQIGSCPASFFNALATNAPLPNLFGTSEKDWREVRTPEPCDDHTLLQFQMDSNGAELQKLLQSSAKVRTVAQKSRSCKRLQKRRLKKIIEKSQTQYLELWTYAWGLPTNSHTSCVDPQSACQTVDPSFHISRVLSNTNGLSRSIKKLVRSGCTKRFNNERGKKILRKAKKYKKAVKDAVVAYPVSVVQCNIN